jgi:hypothetical protein
MRQTIDRHADYPVNPDFDPLDQEFGFDPNCRFAARRSFGRSGHAADR